MRAAKRGGSTCAATAPTNEALTFDDVTTECDELREALQALYDATTDTMAGWIVRTGSDKWVAFTDARAMARKALTSERGKTGV